MNRSYYQIFHRVYFIIFFIFISYYSNLAQGFDWQYNPRLPFSVPNFYIGISGDISYALNTGNISLKEDTVTCINSSKSPGFGREIGLQFEYWNSASTAFISKINFNYLSSSFSGLTQEPKRDGTIVTTKYELYSYISYLNFQLGFKKRILPGHLFFDFSIETSYLIKSSGKQTETILSPNYHYREIYYSNLQDLVKIQISPKISAGTDFSLGKSIYGQIKIGAAFPVMSASKVDDWHLWRFFLSLSILKGII